MITQVKKVYVSPDMLTRLAENQRVGAFENLGVYSGYWLKSESTDVFLIEQPQYDPNEASCEGMTDEEVMDLLSSK